VTTGADLLGALADEPRLRAFAAVLLGASTTGEAARQAGLRDRDALKALTTLEAVGLVTREADRWLARPKALREAVVATASPRAYVDHGTADARAAAVLRRFMPEGRLDRIPSSWSKRLVVLDHIVRVFEPGVRYAEPDVNAMLSAFHPDYAALRRYLVDESLLAREGGTYWRVGGTVEV
jgi:hypothetical protein